MPVAEPGESADVEDDAEVIGVSVEGRARAYLISAMSRQLTHVIDDVIEGVPVTATYCDRTSCARVFTGPKSDQPLEVGLGGWLEGEMLLQISGRFFRQDSRLFLDNSGELPFDDLSFERTTWKEWKAAHPDTDIFTGSGTAPE
jgi:hypothetical protein